MEDLKSPGRVSNNIRTSQRTLVLTSVSRVNESLVLKEENQNLKAELEQYRMRFEEILK